MSVFIAGELALAYGTLARIAQAEGLHNRVAIVPTRRGSRGCLLTRIALEAPASSEPPIVAPWSKGVKPGANLSGFDERFRRQLVSIGRPKPRIARLPLVTVYRHGEVAST